MFERDELYRPMVAFGAARRENNFLRLDFKKIHQTINAKKNSWTARPRVFFVMPTSFLVNGHFPQAMKLKIFFAN